MSDQNIKEAIHTDAIDHQVRDLWKRVRSVAAVTALAIAALTIGNVIGWWYVLLHQEVECVDRRDRIEGTRQVWHAVFDELEKMGAADANMDRLQNRVDAELPPLTC